MKMENGYRKLEIGEIVKEGDEVFDDSGIWTKYNYIGVKVENNIYRRKLTEIEKIIKELKKIKSWCHFRRFKPGLVDIENLKYLKSFLRIKKLVINDTMTIITLNNGCEGRVKWKDGDTWSLKEGIFLAFAKAIRDVSNNFNSPLGYYPLTAKIDTEAYIPASYKWVNHHLDTRCSNKHLFPNFEEKEKQIPSTKTYYGKKLIDMSKYELYEIIKDLAKRRF
jgi:hypothetical protein